MNEGPGLVMEDIVRTFVQGSVRIEVLKGATLTISPGEIVAISAPSGAGKSTLLHIAGLLDRPDEGEITLGGEACGALSDSRRTELRRTYVGFVYQFHHLLPEFSAEENIVLPQLIAGAGRGSAHERARDLLAMMGLSERAAHRPARLSGGEQQRVAIARAIANRPRVLLADEPTGNLDQETAQTVFDELIALIRETGVAALIATHNSDLAERMDRIVTLREGRVVEA